MNKRIKELATQATRQYSPTYYTQEWIQGFAQLIVRECLKICQNHPSIIFKNEWDADVVSTDIVSRLESHFGVEE